MNALLKFFVLCLVLSFSCLPMLALQAASIGDQKTSPQLDKLPPILFTADGAPSCSGQFKNRHVPEEGYFRVGGRVLPPKPRKTQEAPFPDEAREYAQSTMKSQHIERFEAKSLLRVAVDTNGVPKDVCVINELGHGFDRGAFDAVTSYRFKPATLDGKPVPVRMIIEVNWSLP